MATNNAVNVGLSAASGTGSFAGTNSPTFSTLINIDNLRLSGNTISSTNTDGNILVIPNGTGNVGIFNTSPVADIDAQALDPIVGDNRTDATDKYWRPKIPNYTNSEGYWTPVFGASESGTNVLHLGGGTSSTNCATSILFRVAANTTTVTGTIVGDFTTSGLRLGGANSRVTTILDEDDMVTDSPTALATQQSIKAYVDSKITQGTWTPVFTFATPGDLSVSYSAQTGSYTRVGNIVLLRMSLTFTPTFTTSAGNMLITGLPIVSSASEPSANGQATNTSNIAYPVGVTTILPQIDAASSQIKYVGTGSAIATVDLTTANITSGVSTSLSITIAYNV